MTRRIIALSVLAAAAYFAVAFWLQYSYVDLAPKGSVVVQIVPPFARHGNAAVSYFEQPLALQTAARIECTEGVPCSPLEIYEDGIKLGPGSSDFAEIAEIGRGHFAHSVNAIAFSSSDNSDPATNGRHYWAVLP